MSSRQFLKGQKQGLRSLQGLWGFEIKESAPVTRAKEESEKPSRSVLSSIHLQGRLRRLLEAHTGKNETQVQIDFVNLDLTLGSFNNRWFIPNGFKPSIIWEKKKKSYLV